MKKLPVLLMLAGLAFGCSKNAKETSTADSKNNNLDAILKNYYEDRLKLYPLEATAIADHRYDDQLPNDITAAHRTKLRNFYTQYLNEVKNLDSTALNDQEKLSYQIFKRDMQLNLEQLSFPEHLMPINQFYSLPITMGQLGSGAGNHPFKTAKDYDN